jgi:hypothetical protein
MAQQVAPNRSLKIVDTQLTSSQQRLLQLISIGEAAKPGPILDPSLKAFLVTLWQPTYDQIGEAAFYAAFCQVLVELPFRPDIAEIRKAAGVNRGVKSPIEREALGELRRLIEAMRVHGPKMKPKRGNLIRDRDEDGRLLTVPEYEMIQPPVPSPVVVATLKDLGYGDLMAGLDVISRHPALNPPPRNQDGDGSEHSFRNKLGKDIDAQWSEAFREARMSTQRS